MSVMEPQAHQRPHARPRSKSGFSFKSDKSGSSTKSPKRETLIESHEEKRKTYLSQTTKANPNAAINEMQPSMSPPSVGAIGHQELYTNADTVAAALEKPTLAPLRSSSYSDAFGNPIGEYALAEWSF